MIPILLATVSFCVLAGEFWTGIAVLGLSGDEMIIERAKRPGPFWFTMVLHTFAGIVIPGLAYLVS